MTKANNSFAVEIPSRDTDPNLFYKKELLALIAKNYPEFTVSGKTPPVVRRGVEHASYGNLLTFGTSKTHDVEWVERTGYACEKGYAPVYNLVKDWKKITSRLEDLNNERYPAKLRLSNGLDVEFFDNFVKVGYNRVSYSDIRATKVSALNIFFSNSDIEAMYWSIVR
jgi:hypothetical protein